ncbi:MAG: phosphatidylglycerol lysyltransferase [Treponema sp.]|jgi:phosphoglucomutase|nr:phosphatidylglycerol lysyltransferase [Treponema sp.]
MVFDSDTRKALEGMILSPSGWRGIFAASGNEEDPGDEVSPPLALIAAAGAAVFADYLRSRAAGRPQVILGRDTRPTGKAIADLMIRSFLASGCDVRYAGIIAAPEIMAYAKRRGRPPGGEAAGFCYISASHNPIGHNGLKFGLDDGGVLEGEEALKLIAALRAFPGGEGTAAKPSAPPDAEDGLESRVREVYAGEAKTKEEALGAYREFSVSLVGNGAALEAIAGGLKTAPLGIAADFNGSARTRSIDRAFCQTLGIGFHAINEKPGQIVHAIIPEGNSLEDCRAFLEKLHREDPSVILGYVPDCDGDRGNLVIWDDGSGGARILEAQEVFALACMAELAQLVWSGVTDAGPGRPAGGKAAVAVNGPTSTRIDRIAEAFGAEVFRAEVGEANVVNLARRLRREGYIVRILGEGSNGGNITHPSAVRDPLATIFALVKLMTIRGTEKGPGLFDIWRERSGRGGPGGGFTLAEIIASLPRFFTTGASTPEAKLQVKTRDHALLKDRYQRIFEQAWALKKEGLREKWGITEWEGRACVGPGELRNLSRFGDAETGGLKIVFKNPGGREIAFIWMRGSKTEPVFRVMADAEGSAELERELIAWQRAMTMEADAAASPGGGA